MSNQWAVHNTVIKNIYDLIEYDSNPREHSPEQVEQVANSIKEFGWTMPILIDEKNEIIAGHGRLLAGKQLNIKEIIIKSFIIFISIIYFSLKIYK